LDFPSDNLEKLLGQIPEDEDWYDLICDEISKIGDKLRKEINED
jgi:hypothetical protein